MTDGVEVQISAGAAAARDAVTRLMRLKFSHVPKTRLETAVNGEGETLEQAIAAEVRKTTMTGEYIKSKFWVRIEEEFNLQCADWEALPQPDAQDDTDTYDMDLPDIMRLILGDNPATKTKGMDRLESHLDTCERLPLRQVYGLLRESCEGAKLTRAQSLRFQWTLLRYIAKHEAGKRKTHGTATRAYGERSLPPPPSQFREWSGGMLSCCWS